MPGRPGQEKRLKGFNNSFRMGTLSLTYRGNFSHRFDKIFPGTRLV